MVSTFCLSEQTLVMTLPPVGSVDVTAWPDSLQGDEAPELCIEVRQDRMPEQVTSAVKRSKLMIWNQEFFMYA